MHPGIPPRIPTRDPIAAKEITGSISISDFQLNSMICEPVMKTYFLRATKRGELPAGVALASVLIAAFLAKTGFGWWGIATMIVVYVLEILCKASFIARMTPLEGASTDPAEIHDKPPATQARPEPQVAMAA
jgi:hypothetical protein